LPSRSYDYPTGFLCPFLLVNHSFLERPLFYSQYSVLFHLQASCFYRIFLFPYKPCYGSKVWHSNSKYRRIIYQCNHKFKGGEKCGTPHVNEEIIKQRFVLALNQLLTDKNEIITNLEEINNTLLDTASAEAERGTLQNELVVVAELIQKCVEENARIAQNQEEYQRNYEGLVERFNSAQTRLDAVMGQISDAKARGQSIGFFIDKLRKQEGLVAEFDDQL
jgi:hypothetical protein